MRSVTLRVKEELRDPQPSGCGLLAGLFCSILAKTLFGES